MNVASSSQRMEDGFALRSDRKFIEKCESHRWRGDNEKWRDPPQVQPLVEYLETMTARAINAHKRHFSYIKCRHAVGQPGARGATGRAVSSGFTSEFGLTTPSFTDADSVAIG